VTSLAELRESRELLVNLTQREVRGKYKRSVLGQSWSLLNPLAQVLVFTIVFSLFLRIPPDLGEPSGLRSFALQLLAALLPWAFFANSVSTGMGALLGNANLVKKVYFPREVLVASTVFSLNVTFAVELLVLLAAVVIVGGFGVLPYLVVVPYLVLCLTAFGLGLALALAVSNVYFRDTAQFVGIGLQVWFYLTPVIYTLDYVAQAGVRVLGWPVEDILGLNPMSRFVEAFRNVFYDFRFPSLGDLAYVTVAGAVSLVLGYLVFRRFEGRLAEEL
jgi:ABC-type polysaccharide/polyol phosphate export permease